MEQRSKNFIYASCSTSLTISTSTHLRTPAHRLERPTLCVHSSPLSSSANCTPSVGAATAWTQSTSCACLSDEEMSTTILTCHHHLPYSHPRLTFPSSGETCSIVLNPHAPNSWDRDLETLLQSSLLREIQPLDSFLPPVRSLVIEGWEAHRDLLFCLLHHNSLGLLTTHWSRLFAFRSAGRTSLAFELG